jgi:hypothetical protein
MAEALGDLDGQALAGAHIYLSFGPATLPELIRVLGQHLEIRDQSVVAALLWRLIDDNCLIHQTGMVSLPAGSDTRAIKEGR